MANSSIWNKKNIVIENGDTVQAMCPIVISASRSTDIPAFHSDWFMNRLKEGYIKWVNPFNQKPNYVSFDECRIIVFWTKNPKPIMKYLKDIDDKGIGYYFQYTINNYSKEIEPNVPPLAERIETFIKLSKQIGKGKIVWRYDPIFMEGNKTCKDILDNIKEVGEQIYPYTENLVISFADILAYKKVENNLKRHSLNLFECNDNQILELAEGLQKLNSKWKLSIKTCAEKINLSKYGIEHNKCIDDSLLLKYFGNDFKLLKFLGVDMNSQLSLFQEHSKPKNLKDSGQRKECGCVLSKDIGQYNTCKHLCAYCYANTSDDLVLKNLGKKDKFSRDTII